MPGPTVNVDECTGCGSCVDECPNDVLEVQDDKCTVVNGDDCVECSLCVDACPADALSLD